MNKPGFLNTLNITTEVWVTLTFWVDAGRMVFIWGVRHGVGNKRQGVERQELCGLAQGRPFGLQEGFEIRNPFIQVLFVLQGREDVWDLRLDAGSPVHLSSPQGSLGSSHVAAILLAWASLRAVCSHPNNPHSKMQKLMLICTYLGIRCKSQDENLLWKESCLPFSSLEENDSKPQKESLSLLHCCACFYLRC